MERVRRASRRHGGAMTRAFAVLSAAVMGMTAAGVAQADDRWTGGASDLKWKTAGNWSAGAMPGAADTALFDGAGTGTVQLEGFTRTLSAIHFANAYPSGGYTIAGGTLVLNQITSDNFVAFPNNTIAADVTAAGTTLTLTSNGGFLDVSGVVSATNLAVTGAGTVQLFNTGNALSGVQVADGASLAAVEPGSLGGAGSTVTLGNGASLATSTGLASATFANGVTVAGSAVTIAGYASGGGTVNMGSLNVGSSFVDYETATGGTLAFSSAQLSGDVTFATSISNGFLRLGPVTQTSTSSISVAGGQLRLAGAGSYTGGTSIYGSSTVELLADGALGSGAVGVFQDGILKISTAQTALPATTVYAYGTLTGNTTNLHYSGPSRNVFLNTDAVLAVTSGPVPVRGVDVNSAAYYLGITSATQTASVGEDGLTSIYKGIAFGRYTPTTPLTVTVSEKVAGQGIEVYTDRTAVRLHGGVFNTTNTITGVHFFGNGEVALDAAPAGSATVYSFTGAGDATSQGTYVADLLAEGVIAAGKTLNVSDGILYVGAANAVAGTVNIKSGGTLMLSSLIGPTVNPSTGTYVVQSGGAVYLDGASEHLGGGATFTFQTGSLLALTSNTNTSAGAGWSTSGADVVVAATSPITVSGPGLVLANGRRLTTSAFADATVSGGAITAAPGATVVSMTAATGNQLRLNNNVSLAGVDLFVGSQIAQTTLDGTFRQTAGQSGTVQMYGSSNTVRNLTVDAGNFTFGDGAGDALTADMINVAAVGGTTTLAAGTVTAGQIVAGGGTLAVNTKVVYVSPATTSVTTGGAIVYNVSAQPTIPVTGATLSIGAGASATAAGTVDPFTDNNGTPADPSDDRSMAVTNTGTFSVTAGNKRIKSLDGTGATSVTNASLSTAYVRQGSLTATNGTVSVRADGTAAGASKVASLTITGTGELDLSNNVLVVDYTGATVANSMRTMLLSGRNASGTLWTGPGIVSSTAAADAQQRTAIGYIEASQLLGLSGATTATWYGQTVDATSVLLKYTWYGDANFDGKINADDYALLDRGYAKGLTGWVNGDFNYDNVVNSADYLLIDRIYTQQTGVLSPELLATREAQFGGAYVAALVASVPEPSSVAVLATAGLAVCGGRRRRFTPARPA